MPLIPGPQFVSAAARAGRELGYDQRTTDFTADTATPGTDVIACAAHDFPGTPVWAEFQASGVQTGASDSVTVALYEGVTLIGVFGVIFAAAPPGLVLRAPFRGGFRFTPTAGSHTYTVKAYKGTADGVIQGGALGAANASPIWVAFTEIVL